MVVIKNAQQTKKTNDKSAQKSNFMFQTEVDDHIRTIRALRNIEPEIKQAANILTESIRRGGKILICGNGGSATDAQHFAGEIVGRFRMERPA